MPAEPGTRQERAWNGAEVTTEASPPRRRWRAWRRHPRLQSLRQPRHPDTRAGTRPTITACGTRPADPCRGASPPTPPAPPPASSSRSTSTSSRGESLRHGCPVPVLLASGHRRASSFPSGAMPHSSIASSSSTGTSHSWLHPRKRVPDVRQLGSHLVAPLAADVREKRRHLLIVGGRRPTSAQLLASHSP
jgi:hypothetical protein